MVTCLGEKRRILVVDDDSDVLDTFVEALEHDGYATSSAPNGLDALEQLRNGLRPCAILLDLMMPVMDGWHFREEQLQDPALASIPVVVISAMTSNANTASLRPAALLRKPIQLKTLLDTVKRICP